MYLGNLGRVTFAARMVRDFNEVKTPTRSVAERADVYTPTMIPAGSGGSRVLTEVVRQIAAQPPKGTGTPAPAGPIKPQTATPEVSRPLTYTPPVPAMPAAPRPPTTVKTPTTRATPSAPAANAGGGSVGSGVTVTGGQEKPAQDSGNIWPLILGALAAASFF